MGPQNKSRDAMLGPSGAHVDVDFKIVVRRQAGTLCDKRVHTFSFRLEHEFEKVAEWLTSEIAYAVFAELNGEIGEYINRMPEFNQ